MSTVARTPPVPYIQIMSGVGHGERFYLSEQDLGLPPVTSAGEDREVACRQEDSHLIRVPRAFACARASIAYIVHTGKNVV
jgi:hypothetical protein